MKKNKEPFLRATGMRAVARGVLLLLILGATAWAFSARFTQRLAALNANSAIVDETDSLTSAERERLLDLAGQFQTDFGIRLRLKISHTDVRPHNEDKRTLFMGVSPGGNEVIFALPPLAKKALPELALKAEEKNLLACMKHEKTGTCVEKTLLLLHGYFLDE